MSDTIVTETARRIHSDLADPQTVNRHRDERWREALWRALEDAGLPLAWVGETSGGTGGSIADGFEIAAIAGEFAGPSPLTETLLAGWLLGLGGLDCPKGMMSVAPCRPGEEIGLSRDGRLSGRARAVAWAREAAYLAVVVRGSAGLQIALVDAKSCIMADRTTLNGISSSDVVFEAVSPVRLAAAPAAFRLTHLMQMGATLRAVETAHALQAILNLATDYAQERVAFGKPIAKFQAVQHNLARLAGETAVALTAAGSAAEALAAIDADPARFDDGIFLETASARIRSAEAATEGAAICHQVFGAIGFTKEHILHRYTLKLLAWRDDFGNESSWAVDLGRLVAANGADELWPFLSSR